MSEIKHTPLAWVHTPTGNVFPDAALQDQLPIWRRSFGDEVDADFAELVPRSALTDAASEMLEALRMFVAAFAIPLRKDEAEAIKAARAAIAKAEGKS